MQPLDILNKNSDHGKTCHTECEKWEALLSEVEPIIFRPGLKGDRRTGGSRQEPVSPVISKLHPAASTRYPQAVRFDRFELDQILNLYGRKVASGDWRDYAMDFGSDCAVFSVFRRASETPVYRIEKSPKLARKQGAYAVVSAHGLILKRGHNLSRVLRVLDKTIRLVEH